MACGPGLAFALLLVSAPVRQQSIPFSHRKHCAAVACSVCHATAATGERAGLPSTSQCMLCHNNLKKDSGPIRKLVEYDKQRKPVPWVRLYLLPDFVFFSHAKHAAAKVECAACHGPVAQRDVLVEEVPVKMKTCIDCHRIRGASIECNLCHELAQ